jgi:hypothetical protein
MIDTVNGWLNGPREFNMGVALFNLLSHDQSVKDILSRGASKYTHWRLQEEMLALQVKLKSTCHAKNKSKKCTGGRCLSCLSKVTPSAVPGSSPTEKKICRESREVSASLPLEKTGTFDSTPLYKTCVLAAINKFKESMDARAVVRAMIPDEKYADPNRQDLVMARRELTLKSVKFYLEASKLFDRADHVRLHGRLPDEPPIEDQTNIADVPDHRVYLELTNARKAYNKLKDKQDTPELISLKEKHQVRIQKLEERWLSLG